MFQDFRCSQFFRDHNKHLIAGYFCLSIIAFVILLIPAFSFSESNNRETHSTRDLTPASETSLKEITIGILAKRGKERVDKRWQDLATYLNKTIPGHVFKIIPLEYRHVRMAVRDNRVDFILANPAYYVEFEQKYGIKKLACLTNTIPGKKNHREYAGVIFCRSNRIDISDLHDFKGKKFMAVDRDSFGGWHMALHKFKSHGIDPERDFSHLLFGNDNDNVVYGVLNGSVDGGTVRSDTLERMAHEGSISLKNLKVLGPHFVKGDTISLLHSTQHYPEWPFASLKGTSRELARKVTIALLQMPLISESPLGYSWDVAQNYQSVHECLKDLQLTPYEDYGKTSYKKFLWNNCEWLLAISILTGTSLGLAFFIQRLKARLDKASAVAAERINFMAMVKSVVDVLPTGVMIVDKKSWNVDLVNTAAEKMIGLTEDQIINKSCSTFLATDEAREIRSNEISSENQSTGKKVNQIGQDKIMIRGNFQNSSSLKEIL